MHRLPILPVPLLAAALILGCASTGAGHHEGEHVVRAIARMLPTEGSAASGFVTFTQAEGGVRIQAEVTGLTPGDHGFHVHQWGDTTAPDGTSAGGHFNPHATDHALPEAAIRHVGDLGNLTAGADGRATYDRIDTGLAFSGPNSIIGRGLVIHAKMDDGGQPTGNAGARVAVGVIGIAKDGTTGG